VRSDDPRLNVRLNYGAWVRQPLRVVLDTNLTCAPTAKVFNGGGALVFAATDTPLKPTPGVEIEQVPRRPGGLDLSTVVKRLAERDINELLVECGATLAGAFMTARLVDELVLYVAPKLLGNDAAPLVYLDALAATSLPPFEIRDTQRFGTDLRLILNPGKLQ
jgi:diaminohydroxyphosphoribosylaminopyrimidine deaminase / 5-amino-6-(5-phosphoribosylamino)uracil reductase